jgi:hypothetical protein
MISPIFQKMENGGDVLSQNQIKKFQDFEVESPGTFLQITNPQKSPSSIFKSENGGRPGWGSD